MQINDNVLYTENGVGYVATVLEIREFDHHMGENGEPLLHLGFFKPVMKADATGKMVRKAIVGTHEQFDLVQFRLDVVHDSHSFGEEAQKKGFSGVYPGGRWQYITFEAAPPVVDQESIDETPAEEIPAEGTTPKKKKKSVVQ
jgi:hypothetical protein